MKEILSLVYRVAPSQATVLITGESGTGKELLARAIHEASQRKGRFVAVSCAAIPDTLLESELFGYERGAFTGADRAKPGKFELADGGTLFLDEVGDLPPLLQPKLLRVLQEREVERLGGTRPTKVDVRVVAATNQDLKKKVSEGKFREDLYYRLNVVNINIPPLRERKEDILPLAYHFLKIFREELKKPVEGFTREAERLLLKYNWPGNVRELENAIERAVVLTRKNFIVPEDLPISVDRVEEEPLRLEEVEARHIKRVLDMAGGNMTKASQILCIHRNTLREKMRRYGIRWIKE
jgi:transcriptional regulator with PAS, ATPase and Fis domain